MYFYITLIAHLKYCYAKLWDLKKITAIPMYFGLFRDI